MIKTVIEEILSKYLLGEVTLIRFRIGRVGRYFGKGIKLLVNLHNFREESLLHQSLAGV